MVGPASAKLVIHPAVPPGRNASDCAIQTRALPVPRRGRGSSFGYEWIAKSDNIVPNTRARQGDSVGVGMTGFSTSRILLLVAFGLFAATGVSAQVAPPALNPTLEPTIKVHPTPEVKTGTPAGIVPGTCICTAQYDPVCARTRNGTTAVFSNACRARCADATVVARGKC
jgi:hypothetical protein